MNWSDSIGKDIKRNRAVTPSDAQELAEYVAANTGWKHYPITPVGKPRMTQRDRWKKRPCVLRYHAFKDQCREAGIELCDSVSVRFFMPMPDSWSKKKKREMLNQPHQQIPDIDNLLKALLDACLDDDSSVYAITAIKHWDVHGGFELWQG